MRICLMNDMKYKIIVDCHDCAAISHGLPGFDKCSTFLYQKSFEGNIM